MNNIASEKSKFSSIFILFVVMLISLPFLTTFQDILTRIVMYFSWYRWLQYVIVPYEMRVLTSLLNLLHIHSQAEAAYIQFMKNGKPEVIYLIWNCVGWQSLLIFLLTIITGFSGNFTLWSKR